MAARPGSGRCPHHAQPRRLRREAEACPLRQEREPRLGRHITRHPRGWRASEQAGYSRAERRIRSGVASQAVTFRDQVGSLRQFLIASEQIHMADSTRIRRPEGSGMLT
jgi:hypothetical protein